MSGGIDSSAAAWRLVDLGCRVAGVTFILPSESLRGEPAGEDERVRRARSVCRILGIPHHVRDLRSVFEERIIRRFVAAYGSGTTPNPCVLCNELVKFPALEEAAGELGFGGIATGHYARLVRRRGGRIFLAKASDPVKDQSYFLHRVPVRLLAKTVFPLGTRHKRDLAAMAARLGIADAPERESQDICFLRKGGLRSFLDERLGPSPGPIVDGRRRIIGEHGGIHRYTVGQRRGLGVSSQTPLYVKAIERDSGAVHAAPEEELFSDSALVGSLRLRFRILPRGLEARIRYRHPPAAVAEIRRVDDGLLVRFTEPQRAITPGQALVLYQGEIVVGGGVIAGTGTDTG